MRVINGTYYVADCEHNGDIERAKSYLRSNGCEVVSHYWDGHDCGEAYIEFTCKESDFVSLYKKLGGSASFDANINDYVKLDGLKNYKKMRYEELSYIMTNLSNDLSDGFWNRLPLHLFFEVREREGLTKDDIVSKCLSYLTKDAYEVIGYSLKIVDGCEYLDMLIKTTYKNLNSDTIGGKGIGDYCLGHDGWLSHNGIYGECHCVHSVCNTNIMWYYDLLHRVVEKIINKEDLFYKHLNYYRKDEVSVPYEKYFEGGEFHKIITHDENHFKLKDPRFWVKCNE